MLPVERQALIGKAPTSEGDVAIVNIECIGLSKLGKKAHSDLDRNRQSVFLKG